MMAIKNYTTSISVEKTAAEIQGILAKAKASAIMTEYDDDGVMTALSFRVNTPHGLMSFRLPANTDKIEAHIHRSRDVPKRLKSREQAARVAWRILKDWIAAQIAIIEAEMATLEEVFLPYAQTQTGETVYERFKDNTSLLLLEG